MNKIHLVPMAAFALYFVKVSLFPISYPEAACLAVLGLTACYFQFKNNDAKIKELEIKFEEAMKKHDEEMLQVTKIRDTVNGLKLNSLTRPMSNVNNR